MRSVVSSSPPTPHEIVYRSLAEPVVSSELSCRQLSALELRHRIEGSSDVKGLLSAALRGDRTSAMVFSDYLREFSHEIPIAQSLVRLIELGTGPKSRLMTETSLALSQHLRHHLVEFFAPDSAGLADDVYEVHLVNGIPAQVSLAPRSALNPHEFPVAVSFEQFVDRVPTHWPEAEWAYSRLSKLIETRGSSVAWTPIPLQLHASVSKIGTLLGARATESSAQQVFILCADILAANRYPGALAPIVQLLDALPANPEPVLVRELCTVVRTKLLSHEEERWADTGECLATSLRKFRHDLTGICLESLTVAALSDGNNGRNLALAIDEIRGWGENRNSNSPEQWNRFFRLTTELNRFNTRSYPSILQVARCLGQTCLDDELLRVLEMGALDRNAVFEGLLSVCENQYDARPSQLDKEQCRELIEWTLLFNRASIGRTSDLERMVGTEVEPEKSPLEFCMSELFRRIDPPNADSLALFRRATEEIQHQNRRGLETMFLASLFLPERDSQELFDTVCGGDTGSAILALGRDPGFDAQMVGRLCELTYYHCPHVVLNIALELQRLSTLTGSTVPEIWNPLGIVMLNVSADVGVAVFDTYRRIIEHSGLARAAESLSGVSGKDWELELSRWATWVGEDGRMPSLFTVTLSVVAAAGLKFFERLRQWFQVGIE